MTEFPDRLRATMRCLRCTQVELTGGAVCTPSRVANLGNFRRSASRDGS